MKHKGWYSRNYLPHLDSPGQIQSITFRLHDALPLEVINRLEKQIAEGSISDLDKRKSIEKTIDAGYGSCWLKDSTIANIVKTALQYFDGQRYQLLAWCIMPNHVHILLETKHAYPLDKIVQSWKSFTAKQANKHLGRSGTFWQRDYYDRYIRDDKHLIAVTEYIENNPVKAGLVKNKQDWKFSSQTTGSTTGSAGILPANKKPTGCRRS